MIGVKTLFIIWGEGGNDLVTSYSVGSGVPRGRRDVIG